MMRGVRVRDGAIGIRLGALACRPTTGSKRLNIVTHILGKIHYEDELPKK